MIYSVFTQILLERKENENGRKAIQKGATIYD